MRIDLLAASQNAAVPISAGTARFWLFCALLLVQFTSSSRAAEREFLHYQMPAAVTNSAPIRPSSRWTRLNLVIGLPLRNREELTNLLQQLYDPASTNYHRFLKPEEFAAKFGPTEQDYQAVISFAQSHGLIVTGKYSNRTLVGVRGMVADVEGAFHVTLNEYQHPTESRTFFAPDGEPSVDLAVPVLAVSGLDNYALPRPRLQATPLDTIQKKAAANAGSGPGGLYSGGDFRKAYVPDSNLTGSGQVVGLLQFDGYSASDIAYYESQAGLPSVTLSNVLLDGFSGTPTGTGGEVEVSLDIEMAISMAPGLSKIMVYEAGPSGNWHDMLNRMATDNVAKQLSCSWYIPGGGADVVADQIFQQMAAQGQSFFNASGDNDAFTGLIDFPGDTPYLTQVGGTTLTTTGPGGSWVSETVWNRNNGIGSGGGISTQYPIPSWQTNMNMTANQGSTINRNIPDVALTAENIYVRANGRDYLVAGTSCAAPLWAGFTALVNQLALANGQPVVGFINPVVYGMGKGSNALSYTSLFHDITTGNNESSSSPTKFSAVGGYDLCTGWGTPLGNNLITALAIPEPLRITPGGGVIMAGPVGGPFSPAMQAYTLTNNAASALNWSLVNTSSWFNVSPLNGTLVQGGPATTVIISPAPATTNLPSGSYSTTLLFSNQTDNFVQTRQVTLAIVTPPIITAQPTNLALLVGTTGSFSVSIASNALMFYQWQDNGTNLSDAGKISGSTTSTLTVSSVTSSNVGAYSVILSNAAGVLASSNAFLTIVPSAPVIVLQPTNQTVLPGASASFSVAAVGNTPYLYHWQANGTNLTNGVNFSGVTNSTLTVSNVSTANAGNYSVIVSNTIGSVASTGAVLSVISVTAPGIAMSTMWSFTDGNSGEFPYSPLAQAKDGSLYGTTIEGGTSGEGTIFKVTTNGALTTLLSFNVNNGAIPYGGLVLGKDSFFYGTAYTGGTYGDGTTFRITTAGTLTTLTTFNGNNGMFPMAGLMQGSDGNFYGTALEGGAYGYGTVFRMTASGALTTLVSFNYADGAYPSPVLVQGGDGNFYGTTENGGTNGGLGTVFKVTPSGTLTILYSFNGGSDGAAPIAGVVQGVDGNLYGTTYQGGSTGFGTVFKIEPSGALTTLYSFTGGSDGDSPWGGLVQARDGNLYGTTQSGGDYGFGTVFQIAPTGPLTTLVQFESYNGANPSATLVQGVDGNLYGTTQAGGSLGDGTIFRIAMNGPLQITGQPADDSAYIGGMAQFTVATSGGSPVFYQWQQDGVNLTDGGNFSGSTTATLQITNVAFSNAALYSVTVSNAFNSITSDYAVLEVVYSPPHITAQPAGQTRVAGMTAMFTVGALGDQPLFYQWQKNGTNLTDGGNISGSTTSTLTLASVTVANGGNYSVIVSNTIRAVSSDKALLTVVPITPPSASMTVVRLLNGSDGAFPFAGLIQGKDGNLYGTAEDGGASFQGSIFRMGLNGGLTTLYNFTVGTNGANPYGRLVQGTNGNFYGTTFQGGKNGDGTLFRMTTSSVVTFLYSFTGGVDGADPVAGLVQGADGNFYGTAYQGGGYSFGSIFKMTPAGAVTALYEFTGYTDGAYPYAGLIQGKDGNFYGTTTEGGANGYGTVFRLATNGTLTTLASFNFANGAYPQAGVIQAADGNFYGTTFEGGPAGDGTVFKLTINGALTTVFSFAGTNGTSPAAAVVQGTDGNLYGTTSSGGTGGQGTAFEITTNGALTTLLWFDGLNGANPQAALVQATDGNFYGTTAQGGTGYNPSAGGGNGTIFRLTVPIFISNPFTTASAVACLPYSANLAGKTIAPAGDTLAFAKVSGPVWLNVATNGFLSGTPTNSDIGTNIFIVSLTDSNGVSASSSMNIVVIADPPPSFVSNPFAEPWANVDGAYTGTIATNATAPYLGAGDILTFAKVSGPAWLSIAANGILSGTPQGLNGGTNTFVVSVTGLGGSSNNATMFVYVNSAPMFTPQNFTKQVATVGLPYSGTIATNAADPDLGAGDTLAFYKVTGPAWLNVAANGALSGAPSSADLGINTFLALVVDSGGLAGIGSGSILVNADSPPTFISNPFTEPPIKAGQPYSATIATNAFDPDFGDVLTFSKVSGPAWLGVASNGSLFGTPFSSSVGTNTFVVSIADFDGLFNSATMNITVTPAAAIVANISLNDTSLMLNWTGGIAPYQVMMTTNLNSPSWQNIGSPTSLTNLILSPSNAGAFFRIQGQ
jgi:uncharacterized repeat protein (TIGR03803 family)